jgi:tetratricopeptide (TPR) repeat protein
MDASKRFISASEAYENGEYEKAAGHYESILKEIKNGDLYYNLGNCYFKMGKVGNALLNYLRAKRFKPRSDDINDNINYIRTLTKDKVEDKSFLKYFYKTFSYYDFFNIKEFFYIFMIFNVGFFSLLILRLFIKKPSLNLLRNIILVILFFSTVGYLLNYKSNYFDKRGVVISSEISIKSGCSLSDTTIFNLHEGAQFNVIDEKDNWFKIILLDGKKGWVSKEVVKLI